MISSLYQRSISPQNQIQSTFTSLTTYTSRTHVSFLSIPQIISPHVSSSSSSSSLASSKISSLDIDNTNESRFLLCGSFDGTVSVYDLSLLGSEYYINQDCYTNNTYNNCMEEGRRWKLQNTFRPICHSQKVTLQPQEEDNNINPNNLPNGHCCPITKVLWFTIDSGIFLSSDCIGNIFIWDSNVFIPVSCLSLSKSGNVHNHNNHHYGRRYTRTRTTATNCNTTISSKCTINSFDLPKHSTHHMQLAVGCTLLNNNANNYDSISFTDDRCVYLCDIKSGSTTQQLIGHGKSYKGGGTSVGGAGGGISTVQWSPVNEFILISGGYDGCIKLWDVRKSGSSACLLTLDQEMKVDSTKLYEYENNAWNQKIMKEDDCKNEGRKINNDQMTSTMMNQMKMIHERKRRKLMNGMNSIAPGNYSKVECSDLIQSHDGPVTSLSFTPDGEYIVSASPADGLHLWHLQRGYRYGIKMSTCYLGPNSLTHPLRKKQKKKVPLVITQPGPNKSGTVWIGTNNEILGYDIHGMGGAPNKILSGHIDNVTAVASHDTSMRLFTGGADGMILAWGCD
jgi:DNA excision repair protein ERCC-8